MFEAYLHQIIVGFPKADFVLLSNDFHWFANLQLVSPGIFLHNFPGPFLPKFFTSSLTNWSLFFPAYGFNPAALQLFPLFHFWVCSHDENPFFPILFSLLASYTAWSPFLLKSTRYCCCEKQFLQVKGWRGSPEGFPVLGGSVLFIAPSTISGLCR